MQINPFNSSGLLQMSVQSPEKTVAPDEKIVRERPVSYEEAMMKAAMAKQKAVGQIKKKFPPKSVMERTVESMEEAEKEKKAAKENPGAEDHTAGDTAPVDAGSGETGTNISEYV